MDDMFAIRKDFARRLQNALNKKNWMQADLARAVGVGRDNISKYINAKALPLPHALHALARALDMEAHDLLPTRGKPADASSALHVRELPDGRYWLTINQAVEGPTAIKIQALLMGVAL